MPNDPARATRAHCRVAQLETEPGITLTSASAALLLVVATLASAGIASASAQSRPVGVTFDEAIGLTEHAPDVQALEDAVEVRRSGDDRISDTTEHSRFYVVPGVRLLDEQDRGFEGQIQVGHSWNLAGLADARRHSARDEREALSARARAAALARRLTAAYAWITLARTERVLEIVREVAGVAHRVAERTALAASRGVLTEADRAEADAFTAEAEALVLAGEGSRVAAQLALAGAMGTGEAATLSAEGPPPAPSVPEPEQIEAALRDVEHRPRVIAARLAATAIRARDAEVSAERGTRLDADLIVYRESPGGLMIFPQIGIVVPFADMAARERSVIEEQATIADGSAEATRTDALREAHEVAHEVEHTRATAALLADTLVPALERLAALRRRQLEVSETTVMIALEAERRLLRVRAEMATAEADRTWAEVRAWLLLAELDGSRSVDDGEAP